MRLIVAAAAAAAAIFAATPAHAGPGLPDLTVTVPVVEGPYTQTFTVGNGCAVEDGLISEGTHSLLYVGTLIANVGASDWRIPNPDATWYTSTCFNGRLYVDNYLHLELVDSTGTVVAEQWQRGYCIRDTEKVIPTAGNSHFPSPHLNKADHGDVLQCDSQANNWGITAGWGAGVADVIDGQWINVDGVPAGSYTLRVTVDPLNQFAESDETNNSYSVPVVV